MSHCVSTSNIKYGKSTQCDVTNNFTSDKLGPSLRDKFDGKLHIVWEQKKLFLDFVS